MALKKGSRKALPMMKNRSNKGKKPRKAVPGKSPYFKKK